MAYFTEINYGRELTAAESASLNDYVSTQTTDGTTDGNLYNWSLNQSTATTAVRMWSTLDAGNGFIGIANSFTPPPTSAKIY